MRCVVILCVLGALVSTARADGDRPRFAVSEDVLPEIPRAFLALGVGGGGLDSFRGESFSQGMSWNLQLGYRHSPYLQFVFAGDYLSFARSSKDASQQQAALTLGVRIHPLREQIGSWIGFAPRNLYVRAGVGVGHAIRVPYESLDPRDVEQGDWGPAVTAAIGWAPLRYRGGTLGIEAQRTMVRYDEGTRGQWSINLVLAMDAL